MKASLAGAVSFLGPLLAAMAVQAQTVPTTGQQPAATGTTQPVNVTVWQSRQHTALQKERAVTDPSMPGLVPSLFTPGGIPSKPTANSAHSIAPQPYLFSLDTKGGDNVGKTMARAGVYLTGWDASEYSGVPAGGINHGSFFNNFAGIGLDLDMQKLAHIPGAKIHFLADDVAGQGHAGEFTGSNWGYVSYWGNHDGFQIREFTWDQALFKNKVFLLAGRSMPKGGEFDGSDLYCKFPTFMCSVPTTMTINGSMPSFVTSSWGVRLLIKPTEKSYIKGGIWEAEPWLKATNHNSWPGPDWGFDKSEGEFIPVEGGYRTNFSNDRFPRAYDIGFIYDDAKYSDPLYNTAGQPKALFGGNAQSRRGRTQFYIQAQQMIWKPDARDTRGLILFGAANIMTSGDAPVKDGFVLGVFDWGPFRARPRDSVGLVVQTLRWDRRLVQDMNDTMQKQGHHNQWNGQETMLEINYGANIAPGITLTPYFQYIWNPDELAMSRPQPDVHYAVQSGLLLNIQFNPAFGLPMLHRVRN
ncbi:carbohydrate porin [Komagataeibacter oboediens]|uniref:carbohydrate porin n=1 Tax=Komagataeibacter oboediens TaxID=65958 RepID=UPI000237DA53|nr:carbohydrate porin [Komagataeibacter oboediens]MBV0888354.1 carbohydrate porin [Komagataeibacter oboediens]MCK9820309.1 carbohydrate porin [Komagataeibacter oboediens]